MYINLSIRIMKNKLHSRGEHSIFKIFTPNFSFFAFRRQIDRKETKNPDNFVYVCKDYAFI